MSLNDFTVRHNQIVADAVAYNESLAGLAAADILLGAADAISDRASQRDHPDGERSMANAVRAFNELTGNRLTEMDGWLFMIVLKLARSRGGRFVLDDYTDAAAYCALAGECGQKTQGGAK